MPPVAGLDLGSERFRLAIDGKLVQLGAAAPLVRPVRLQPDGTVSIYSLKRSLGSTRAPAAGEVGAEERMLERLQAVRGVAAADRVAIAVPGSFSQHRRASLRNVAAKVFKGVRLIDDASAAILSASDQLVRAPRVAVLSWGSWGCEAVAFGGDGSPRMLALEHNLAIGADLFDAEAITSALARRGHSRDDLDELATAARSAREHAMSGNGAAIDDRFDSAQLRNRLRAAEATAFRLLAAAAGAGVDVVVAVGGMAGSPSVIQRLRELHERVILASESDVALGAALHAAGLPESAWAVAEPARPEPAPVQSNRRPDPPPRIEVKRPMPRPQAVAKVGRNEKCPCGSGRKYKKCHGAY